MTKQQVDFLAISFVTALYVALVGAGFLKPFGSLFNFQGCGIIKPW